MKLPTREEGQRRLLLLARRIEQPDVGGRFDYGHFVGNNWAGRQDLSCGTTACAAGWGATIPEFRELGYKLIESAYIAPGTGRHVVLGSPSFQGETGHDALQRFFGLDYGEVDYLFYPETAKEEKMTAADVAKRIRMFVSGEKTERDETDEDEYC